LDGRDQSSDLPLRPFPELEWLEWELLFTLSSLPLLELEGLEELRLELEELGLEVLELGELLLMMLLELGELVLVDFVLVELLLLDFALVVLFPLRFFLFLAISSCSPSRVNRKGLELDVRGTSVLACWTAMEGMVAAVARTRATARRCAIHRARLGDFILLIEQN